MSRCFLGLTVIALTLIPQGIESETGSIARADEPATRTFTGQWNNKKYGTSGPLKAVLTESEPGKWSGTFSGTFQRDPFEYPATFESKNLRGKTAVGGTAKIRGHDYQWQGLMQGGKIAAEYRSSVGYYGGFVLQEVKE